MNFDDWKKIIIDTKNTYLKNFKLILWTSFLFYFSFSFLVQEKYWFWIFLVSFIIYFLLSFWVYILEDKEIVRFKKTNKKLKKVKLKKKIKNKFEIWKEVILNFFFIDRNKKDYFWFYGNILLNFLILYSIYQTIIFISQKKFLELWLVIPLILIFIFIIFYFIYWLAILFEYYWILNKREKRKGCTYFFKESLNLIRKKNSSIEKKWIILIIFNMSIFSIFFNSYVLSYIPYIFVYFMVWNLLFINIIFETSFIKKIHQVFKEGKKNNKKKKQQKIIC